MCPIGVRRSAPDHTAWYKRRSSLKSQISHAKVMRNTLVAKAIPEFKIGGSVFDFATKRVQRSPRATPSRCEVRSVTQVVHFG